MSEEIKKAVSPKPKKSPAKIVLKGKKNYPALKIVRGVVVSKESLDLCKKAGINISAVAE